MEYEKALKMCKIIEEIELNNKDIRIFNDAVKDDIGAAEIHIRTKNGNYCSHIYEKDRINILLQVLRNRNAELMQKLEEF